MRDCPFCAPDRTVLLETPGVLAFPDAFPVTDGHTLVCPRRHVERVFDLEEDEWGRAVGGGVRAVVAERADYWTPRCGAAAPARALRGVSLTRALALPGALRHPEERSTAGMSRERDVTSSPAAEPKVACEHLWKVFGPRPDRIVGSPEAELPRDELLAQTGCVAAVRDVSFAVAEGEMFVIMGLSGSGKSTLVRCLVRLVEPTAGTVRLCGSEVTGAPPAALRELRRRSVSMVFQHFGLLPNRKVIDNVAYGLEIQGVSRQARRERAQQMIEVVGLSGFADHYPDELSGGMKQRVGLARALANDPEILLLDEPFSALDPLIRRDMQEEICRLQRQMRKTMVFITHDLSEALRLGDRIVVMRDGGVVQVGTAAELLARPADDYVRDFTRDVPRALVLTAGDICAPADGAAPATGEATRTVDAGTLLRDLIPAVADGADLRVVDGERVLGTVSREAVLGAIYGAPLQAARPAAEAAPSPGAGRP